MNDDASDKPATNEGMENDNTSNATIDEKANKGAPFYML